MFRQRPPVTPSTMPDWADGFCYLAKQSYLMFGRDRKEPVEARFVVSWIKHNDRIIVLPATTQAKDDFFHLLAEQCHQKGQTTPRDSYLCPRYESVPQNILKKIGVLPHPIRIQIVQWLHTTIG